MSSTAAVFIKTGLAKGSYALGSAPGHLPVEVLLDGNPCYDETGNLNVFDAAWSVSGTVIRLSASMTFTCTSASGPPNVHIEIRYHMPDVAANRIGGVEATWNSAPTHPVQVGNAVDIPITVTNFGTAAVRVGPPSVLFQPDALYSEWSVSNDLCTGLILAPGGSCTFAGRHTAIAYGTTSDRATFVIADGLSAPAYVRVETNTTPLQDQPVGVSSGARRGGADIFFNDGPTVSPQGILATEVDELDNSGQITRVLATLTDPYANVVNLRNLADNHAYRVGVRFQLAGGTTGPLSAPVMFTTTPGDLMWANTQGSRKGVVIAGADGSAVAGGQLRLRNVSVTRLAASPNGSEFAYTAWEANGQFGAIGIADTDGSTDGTVITPPDSGTTSDTAPTFDSPMSVVFARTVSGGTPALERYDIPTATTTAVIGGAGLTDPAAAADGTIVAVDVANSRLVRLSAAGTSTPLASTDGATQPSVAADGRVAFVNAAAGGRSTVSILGTDGSPATPIATLPSGLARTPSFSPDSTRLYVSVAPVVGGLTGSGRLYEVNLASGVASPLPDGLGDSTAPVLTDSQDVRVASTSTAATAYIPDPVTRPRAVTTTTTVRLTVGDVPAATSLDGSDVPLTGQTATVTGLTPGNPYTLRAFYSDADGHSTASGAVSFIAAAAPSINIAAGVTASSIVGATPPPFAVAGDADTDSFRCTLDGSVRPCPGGVLQIANLPGGAHSATFQGVNSAGIGPELTRPFTVDRAAPALALASLNPLALTPTVVLAYRATDGGAGVASYDVRRRVAAAARPFSAYATPAGYSGSARLSIVVASPAPGATLCLSVRARDKVGNTTSWSTDRCVTRPIDDRQLARTTKGWSSLHRAAAWLAGSTYTTRASAALTSGPLSRGRIWLLAETCPTCGAVKVFAAGRLLGVISLRSTSTHLRVARTLPRASAGGRITIVTTTRRLVSIDAVAVNAG